MKILNLYAGIGGNRKLWGGEHQITAVELNPQIAKIYQIFFPNDKIVVGDAHQYLLEHFAGFDFIWSSPPCPSHSKLRKGLSINVGAKPIFPDMKLYEEILFLQGYFKGKWCVENVVSWYVPLILPQKISRHYYWANFLIVPKRLGKGKINITGGIHKQTTVEQIAQLERDFGYNLENYNLPQNKWLLYLRNCVEPEIGKQILDYA